VASWTARPTRRRSLTARGNEPRRLVLPDGLDPADLLHRDGAVALRTAIETSGGLADALLDAHLAPALRDGDASNIQATLRNVGAVIVALPPSQWLAHIDRVSKALGVPPGTVHMTVINTEPIIAARSCRITADPQPVSRLTPPHESPHRTGYTGRLSHGTSPGQRHSR
jgi:hypothetical protein